MSAKVIVFMCLVGVALSFPGHAYGPPVVTYKEEPKPYNFAYGVKDDYAGTNFNQNEESDGKNVIGSYSVQLPDGRTQTVKYKADHYNGFIAEVSYYGVAQYPSKPVHPPFIVKPSHYPEPIKHQPVYGPPAPVYH